MSSRIHGLFFLVLLMALTAAPVAAKEKKKAKGDSLADITKEVKTSITKGDSSTVKAALARAMQVRPRYQDKQLKSLVSAVGAGVKHKQAEIAIASIQALESMKVRGSGKQLSAALTVPRKLEDARVEVHLAAIRAAGTIADKESAKPLEKLVFSTDARIAVAAAEALAGFGGGLDTAPVHKLLGQLAGTLDKLDAAARKAQSVESKAQVEKVKAALLQTVKKLTESEAIDSAAALRAWLKEQKKSQKS